jgi:ATP-dependent DNA helicase PIF1
MWDFWHPDAIKKMIKMRYAKEEIEMVLSADQLRAFELYKSGKNVFITGAGGSGKSYLIKHIYEDAIERNKKIFVTALTGTAAILLSANGFPASTLHSWARLGLANGTVDELVHRLQKNTYPRMRWMETQILVVDEVSMLSTRLFETFEKVARIIRREKNKGQELPFGGIQIIFTGDFYQLPPVITATEKKKYGQFCFESEKWEELFGDNQVILNKMFRQREVEYVNILNQIREGHIRKETVQILNQHVNKQYSSSLVIMPTKLYPLKKQVAEINQRKLAEINEEPVMYGLKYGTDGEASELTDRLVIHSTKEEIEYEHIFLKNNVRCEERLILKKGASVMCIVNGLIGGICNGSQGVIIDFDKPTKYPIVHFNNGKIMTIPPYRWKSDAISRVYVEQIPLILAWALTIHKSQGASLDCAEIDVGSGIFECGQTYVALSRVRTMDGLYLTAFDPSAIIVSRKVRIFYDELKQRIMEREVNEENEIIDQSHKHDSNNNINSQPTILHISNTLHKIDNQMDAIQRISFERYNYTNEDEKEDADD